MLIIDINNISYKYDNLAYKVLKNINIKIDSSDKIGLIGKNGSGKTTLLKIINGSLKPDNGHVKIFENGYVGYMSQEIIKQNISCLDYIYSFNKEILKARKILSNINDCVQGDYFKSLEIYERYKGYSIERKINKYLNKFHMPEFTLNKKVSTLSGGEKTKLSLIKNLIQNPILMLLDEPTNNLDEMHISWLEEYLNNCSIPYILISHDRKFLNNTVNKIMELKDSQIKFYNGNYSQYRETKKRIRKEKMKKYKKVKRKIKQLKQDVNRKKQHALKRENVKPKRSISKNGSIQKRDGGTPVIRKEQSLMSSAKAVQTRLDRMKKMAKSVKPEKRKKRKIKIFNKNIRKNILLRARNICKNYDNKIILNNFNFVLKNSEKVALVGSNGTGKTTFFDIITERVSDYFGKVKWTNNLKIGYYDQDISRLNFNNNILEEITGGNLNLQTKARTILGTLKITDEQVYKKIKNLSVGMRNKTLLAKIIFSEPDVLILDEPTNHLEISTREALANTLEKYNGSILFSSHDRYFRENIATRMVEMRE